MLVTRAECELHREVATLQSEELKTVMPPLAVPAARCVESGEKESELAGEVSASARVFVGVRLEPAREKTVRDLLSEARTMFLPLGDAAMAVGAESGVW